jgi:hypothetical protein
MEIEILARDAEIVIDRESNKAITCDLMPKDGKRHRIVIHGEEEIYIDGTRFKPRVVKNADK